MKRKKHATVELLESRRLMSVTLTPLGLYSTGIGGPDRSPSVLTVDSGLNLFGTNVFGQAFEIPAGSGQLESFDSGGPQFQFATYESYGLTDDGAGHLIGVADNLDVYDLSGDLTDSDAVFEFGPATDSFTQLGVFDSSIAGSVDSSVVRDSHGDLFGAMQNRSGGGTIWELPAGSSTITYHGQFATTDTPGGTLAIDAAGDVFGTAQSSLQPTDAGYTGGIVWELPAGGSTVATLATFAGTGTEAANEVELDPAGDLFGVAGGGADGDGAIWKLPAGGSAISTISFTGGNGVNPTGVAVDSAGDVFGDTPGGGSNGYGTLFEVVAGSGTISPVMSFTQTQAPVDPLVFGPDGNLYGMFSTADGEFTAEKISGLDKTTTPIPAGGGPLSATILKTGLPKQITGGASIRGGRVVVKVTNSSQTTVDPQGVNVYAGNTTTVDFSAQLLAAVRLGRPIGAGKSVVVSVPVPSTSSTLAGGAYDIVARAVSADGSGATSVGTTAVGNALFVTTGYTALTDSTTFGRLPVTIEQDYPLNAVAFVKLTDTGTLAYIGPTTVTIAATIAQAVNIEDYSDSITRMVDVHILPGRSTIVAIGLNAFSQLLGAPSYGIPDVNTFNLATSVAGTSGPGGPVSVPSAKVITVPVTEPLLQVTLTGPDGGTIPGSVGGSTTAGPFKISIQNGSKLRQTGRYEIIIYMHEFGYESYDTSHDTVLYSRFVELNLAPDPSSETVVYNVNAIALSTPFPFHEGYLLYLVSPLRTPGARLISSY